MSSERLLTLEEISDRTRLSVSTLRHYRHRGEGPRTFKLGRRVMATEADVEAWIAQKVSHGLDRD